MTDLSGFRDILEFSYRIPSVNSVGLLISNVRSVVQKEARVSVVFDKSPSEANFFTNAMRARLPPCFFSPEINQCVHVTTDKAGDKEQSGPRAGLYAS